MTFLNCIQVAKRTIMTLLSLSIMTAVADEKNGASTQANNTVRIEQGQASGISYDEVTAFLGIPYAKPPVGELRWRAPQDPEPWDSLHHANAFGDACAQFGNFYTSNDAASFDRPYGSEDCLHLNVWAPKRSAMPRPVIVFIHGGSGVHGATLLPLYNGQRLAKELNAVFVSINYRLGFFGNLSLAALQTGDPAHDSGNFALLDQIKALEWVQKNIPSFGGDASNVTVMGHSAGCTSIWSLMRSPLASGKFHKSICLSGLPQESSKEELTETNNKLLANLLIADGIIASKDELKNYLNTTNPTQLKNYLYGKSAVDISSASQGTGGIAIAVDGHVITVGKSGPLVNAVPTLIGTTQNEAPLLLLKKFSEKNYSAIWEMIHTDKPLKQSDFFGGLSDLWKFKVSAWVTNKMLLSMVQDAVPLLTQQSVPVYQYKFNWQKTPEPWRALFGAYHGIDVPFIFGNFGLGTKNFTHFTWRVSEEAERENIHTELRKAIQGFIETADPNKYTANAEWPLWNEAKQVKIIQ